MRILVIRFSAMGDVAMTIPVIDSIARQYPDHDITILTRSRFADLYAWMPSNVHVLGVDLKAYKGLWGLLRLLRFVRNSGTYDVVIDLHDVIRSKFLRTALRVSGCKVAHINKGRREKKNLIGNGQSATPLPTTIERYAQTFNAANLPFAWNFTQITALSNTPREGIGIAPFAAHQGKIYPLNQMHEVVRALAAKGHRVYLFGAGDKEREMLESWQQEGVVSLCGKASCLQEELEIMSRLQLMIAMDSSNMHMAAIMGTPTLSIWGATHPKAGFTAWRQTADSQMQLDLPCRPCSIYGNKQCRFGDYRCLTHISPESIVAKAEEILQNAPS